MQQDTPERVAIVVTQPFAFAHGGRFVETFDAGPDPRETSPECADLAIAEGWARPAADKPARAPRKPRNKDAAPLRTAAAAEHEPAADAGDA